MLGKEQQKELDRSSIKLLFALFAIPSIASATVIGTLAASVGATVAVKKLIADDTQNTSISHLLDSMEKGIIKIQAIPHEDGTTSYSLEKPSGDSICQITADERSLTKIGKIIKRTAAPNKVLTEEDVLSIVNKCANEIKAVGGITMSAKDQSSLQNYADQLAQIPQPMVVTANNNVSVARLQQEIRGDNAIS